MQEQDREFTPLPVALVLDISQGVGFDASLYRSKGLVTWRIKAFRFGSWHMRYIPGVDVEGALKMNVDYFRRFSNGIYNV